jgi:hypothetical protein
MFADFASSPSITSSCLPVSSRSFLCAHNPWVMGNAVKINGINKLVPEHLK